MYTNRLNLQIGRDEAYKSTSARLFAYTDMFEGGYFTVHEFICDCENLMFFTKRFKEYGVEITGFWTGIDGCAYIYFNLADLHKVIKCLNKIFNMNINGILKQGACFYNKLEWLI